MDIYTKVQQTARGFAIMEFSDSNGELCNIQKSSSAMDDLIWLGLDSASPKALHGDATKLGVIHNKTCGWVDYSMPEEVYLSTRMHLNREQAKQLASVLMSFAESGELAKSA